MGNSGQGYSFGIADSVHFTIVLVCYVSLSLERFDQRTKQFSYVNVVNMNNIFSLLPNVTMLLSFCL